MKIIQINQDRWREYKELRLEALRNSPIAFDSSYDEEKDLPENIWKEKLEDGYKVFVEDNGKLVAKMEVEWRKERNLRHIGELFGVYIKPEYRGKGLGKIMWDEVEKLAKEKSLEKFWLDVITVNESAIKLYKKLGFEKVGIYHKAAKVNGEYYDKLLMEKFLD